MTLPAIDDRAPIARADLRAIFATTICTGAGQTFYFAILPPLGREVQLTELQIGSITAIASLIYTFTSPLWGRASDHWGRRRVFLFGVLCYAILNTVFGVVAGAGLAGYLIGGAAFVALTSVRVMFAITAGASTPAAQAYIANSTSELRRTQAIGLLGAALGIGTIAGPGAAALLASYGLVTPIFVISGCVFLAWLAAAKFVRRLPEEGRRGMGRRLVHVPKRVLPLLFVGACVFSTVAAIQQATGFRVQDTQGLGPEETARMAGAALVGSAIAVVFAQAVLIQWLRWPPKRLLLVGGVIGVLGAVILTLSASYTLIVLGVTLMGLSFGFTNPAYTAGLTLNATASEQGSVAGLNGMVQGVGWVVGPLLSGGLYQVSPIAPFIGCAVLMALAIAGTLAVRIGSPRT